MADGRHLENSIISISQLILSCELSYFDRIWYTDADCHSEDGLLTYNQNSANSRRRTDAILKIIFQLYIGAILADQREIWNRNEDADIGHVTKTAIFENSRWRTAANYPISIEFGTQMQIAIPRMDF